MGSIPGRHFLPILRGPLAAAFGAKLQLISSTQSKTLSSNLYEAPEVLDISGNRFFLGHCHRNGIDCLGPPRPGTGGICRGASDLGVAARRVGKPQHGEAEGLGALLGSGVFLSIYNLVGLEHEFYDFPFSWECHHPN